MSNVAHTTRLSDGLISVTALITLIASCRLHLRAWNRFRCASAPAAFDAGRRCRVGDPRRREGGRRCDASPEHRACAAGDFCARRDRARPVHAAEMPLILPSNLIAARRPIHGCGQAPCQRRADPGRTTEGALGRHAPRPRPGAVLALLSPTDDAALAERCASSRRPPTQVLMIPVLSARNRPRSPGRAPPFGAAGNRPSLRDAIRRCLPTKSRPISNGPPRSARIWRIAAAVDDNHVISCSRRPRPSRTSLQHCRHR